MVSQPNFASGALGNPSRTLSEKRTVGPWLVHFSFIYLVVLKCNYHHAEKPLWKIWGISNHNFYSRSHSQSRSAFHYSCLSPLIWYLKNTSLKGKFYDRNPEYRDYTLSRSSWSSLDKINERKIWSPGSTVYMNIHSHYSVNSLKLTHTLTRTC